jgi:hypothetical protein
MPPQVIHQDTYSRGKLLFRSLCGLISISLPTMFALFLVTFLAVSNTWGQDPKKKVEIYKWKFEWVVVEIGSATFRIIKTYETLYTQLTSDINKLRLTPKQAVKVASILRDTKKQFAALKRIVRKKKKTEIKHIDTEVGIKITYIYDPVQGGRVYVSKKGSTILNVGLTLVEAEILAQEMELAVDLAKEIDARIRPNS